MTFSNDSKFIKDDQKKCRTCKKWKPLTDYWKSKFYESGLQASCKKCISKARKKLNEWYRERSAIIKCILMRYPCECGESNTAKLVFRKTDLVSKSISSRTQWDSPEDLKASLLTHRSQCKRCIGSKKPLGQPTPIELTDEEFEALLAPYETRLSKALAKGKKSKKRAVTDQFDELF